MQKQILLLSVLFTFVLGVGWASAGTTYNYSPYDTFDDYDGDYDDIRDLDHYKYYTWGIDLTAETDLLTNLNNGTETITSASFTFYNILDNTSSKSYLYINLLDADNGERGSDINYDSTFADTDGMYDTTDGNQFADTGRLLSIEGDKTYIDYIGTRRDHYFVDKNGDVTKGEIPTTNGPNYPGDTQGANISYDFDAGDLAALNAYIADGFFGFGFDPQCHFYNDGFAFTFTTNLTGPGSGSPVPEPTTMVLFGFGMLCVASRMRKMAQK